MQIFGFMLTISVLLWRHKSKGYSELIEELGCHDTEFRLSCGLLNAKIAIFEAIFSQNDSFLEPLNTSCGNPTQPPNKNSWKLHKLKEWKNYFHWKSDNSGIVEVSFRHIINRRCSGINYCSFVFSEDFEAASRIGPGAVYLRYACVEDIILQMGNDNPSEESQRRAYRNFNRNYYTAPPQLYCTIDLHLIPCNSNIDVSVEGFVRTPGYPEYYIGETTCLWTLKAPAPQRVKVDFLDVSLRGVAPFEKNCLDWLIVSEDGLNLLSTCGDILEDTLILSDGPALNVSFKSSSKTLFPKRGFLFHYKAVGCPSLNKPRDGYLVNKNETFVHYRCCIGFVFPDTLSRDRILKCYNENTWDGVIVDCVNVTELLKGRNYTQEIIKNLAAEAREKMEKSDSLKDIILPTIIMCVLIIGNGIVLYYIHRQRKKLAVSEKMEMKEFLKTGSEA